MKGGDPKRFENDLKKFRRVFRERESYDQQKLRYFYGPHYNGSYKNKHFMKFPADDTQIVQDPGKELWGKITEMITGTEHEEEFLRHMITKIKAQYNKEAKKEEQLKTLSSI